MKQIFDTHDIVLLIETWTCEYSELYVEHFECFVLNRTENLKNSKRASGGIIIYVRNDFVSNDTLLFCSNDDIICIKINGQKLGLNNDLFVCLCYVIPENSTRQSVLEVHPYDRLIEYIGELSSKNEHDFNFVLCGDLNSRTADNPDFVLDDNLLDMDVLPSEYCMDVNTNRQSQDRCTNDNGNRLLELCKQTGLRIMNGRVCNDRDIGRYTFVGSRGI